MVLPVSVPGFCWLLSGQRRVRVSADACTAAKACLSGNWPMPFSSHHAAKRRVAFRYALRVWSLLTWAVKNSRTRPKPLGTCRRVR